MPSSIKRIAKAIIGANLEYGDYTHLLVMITECMVYNTEHGYITSAREARELFNVLYDYAKKKWVLQVEG